jgi:hypothetical protein
MELRGNLRNFPLPDIIQLIGMGQRTGVLEMTLGGQKAQIYFAEGRIVHSSLRNFKGLDAVYRIFQEKDGDFRFFSDATSPEVTIDMDWMNLVMEASRIVDELAASREVAQVSDGVAEAVQPRAFDAAVAKDKMLVIIRHFLGKQGKKLEEKVIAAGMSEIELLDLCDRSEKFISVFIDPSLSKPVADKLRAVVENPDLDTATLTGR